MGIGVFGALVVILDLWALWHCWSGSLAIAPKLLWAIAILIFSVVGPILYALLGRTAVAQG